MTSDIEHPDGDGATDRSARTRRLLDLLAERGRLSVAEATEELGVSEATIRRDFTALAADQLATRTHGGVVATTVTYDLPQRYREAALNGPKGDIAHHAAHLIEPGQVIGFNGGTTTTAAARQVAARGDLISPDGRHTLTIVTNALNIATELVIRPHIRTVSIGGVARPQSYEAVGPLAHRVLSELWLDHLFLGVHGFDPSTGATCTHEDEASINSVMVEHARETTVLTISDKIDGRSFARICATSQITRLITDSGISKEQSAAFEDEGVEVVIAGS